MPPYVQYEADNNLADKRAACVACGVLRIYDFGLTISDLLEENSHKQQSAIVNPKSKIIHYSLLVTA
jgi:hypothetical protein